MVVGDLVAGRYELEEVVGTGGMSSVYRAHDTLLDRKVALKVLHPQYADDEEYVERFRREARAVARLSHPNIVTVIDRGEENGQEFIVFEYVDGQNLKALVNARGAIPVETAVALGHQIARALAFAHEQGLVHRDVKPQNVLLNGDGRAKVTDFGIARSMDVKHGMTQTGAVLGTSDYIAPEQAQGHGVNARTDVYSLGVVLYELLTGEVPFPGENFVAVAMRHINEPPPSARALRRDVPPRLDAALQRAMAKDPADRYPSMDAFCAELEACLRELRRGDPPALDDGATLIVPPAQRRSRQRAAARAAGAPSGRRKLLRAGALVLLGLVAAAAVAAGIVAWTRSDGSGGGETSKTTTAASTPVRLTGVGAVDPAGDGEHDSEAPQATDGDAGTFWTTSSYHYPEGGLGKSGVGIVADAGRQVSPTTFAVVTDTPGFVARIQAGDAAGGPFHDVSGSKTVGRRTTFDLSDAGGRYFVVWITKLGAGFDHAHVNELRAATG